jgi:hypothetical protein
MNFRLQRVNRLNYFSLATKIMKEMIGDNLNCWCGDYTHKELPPLLCKKQVALNYRLRKLSFLYQQIMQLNSDKKFRGTLQEIRGWL